VAQGYFIGKSLGTIYNYDVIGMWQQQDKDNGSIMAGMNPGTYKLLDVNNDGKITSDSEGIFRKNPTKQISLMISQYCRRYFLNGLFICLGWKWILLSGNNTL
jgi:hypothetical protein